MKKAQGYGINLFAGFSSSTASEDKSLFYNPGSPYPESEYYELKNLIEKCSKKSQSTKLKSLSKILTLCEAKTEYTLFIDLLPSWIFIFSKLVKYDSEKSVREAAFKVQTVYFSKFKTKFLNFVQDIFTPLWLGRNDPCKEVSDSAKRAFSTAFPENKHPTVLEKCIQRYISEITPIINKDLQESEEILERLMSCSLLGIKDALLVTPTIHSHCSEFLSDPKIWAVVESTLKISQAAASNSEITQKPLVKCAGLLMLESFISLSLLPQDQLVVICPLIFALIGENNRLVQQVLWGQMLHSFMERFPEFVKYINVGKMLNEVSGCCANGAAGAGVSFYLAIVKVISLVPKEKINKNAVEGILTGILKGLNTDEGGFYGKHAVSAYYEVLLYAFLRVTDSQQYLSAYFIRPVSLYLACTTQITLNSYMIMIPASLSQTLTFLESKNQFPDISAGLLQLLSKSVDEKPEIATSFIQSLSKDLNKGPQCKLLLSTLISSMNSQLTEAINLNISTKSFSDLSIKLPLYQTFSEIAITHCEFEIKVFEWWERACTAGFPIETCTLIANTTFIHPAYWLMCINYSLENTDQLIMLIPEKCEEKLMFISKSQEFVRVPLRLVEKVENSENLSEISKLSMCVRRLGDGMVMFERVAEKINVVIEKILAERRNSKDLNEKARNLGFSKAYELLIALKNKVNEDSAVLLSEFLVTDGWKVKLSELWETCRYIPQESLHKLLQSSQSILISSLKSTKSWGNLIVISQRLFNISQDKISFLTSTLLPELFCDFYENSNPWQLFSSLVIEPNFPISSFLEENIWLFCRLLGFYAVPSLSSSILLLSTLQKFVNSACISLINDKLSTKSLEIIKSVILELMDLSKTYPAFRVVLIKYLKYCFCSDQAVETWTQPALHEFFNLCMSELQSDTNYTVLLCEFVTVFKSILSADLYMDTLEKWQKLAYLNKDQVYTRIYAACIPDDNKSYLENDVKLLIELIDGGLVSTDLALALSIVRRGGFQSIQQLEKVELLVISILLDGKNLHEVLPYVQRLMSTPEVIFNKDEISELIINLPLHNQDLTPPEVLEISETLSRLYSIANEQIDEESLFKILLTLPHINLSKSVYSLLEYVYSQFETTRPRSQPIPGPALALLNYVPNVKCDIMETKTLSYIFNWMLLIEKYKNDRYHREKAKEGVSEFMVCFKDLLENSSEIITVFLTTLMAYLHDETELDLNFSVAWVEVLNEDSCAKLCCLAMYKFLSTFPSFGRNWWLGTDRFLSNSVQNIVKKIISTPILVQEIKNIENRQIEWKEKGMHIVASRAARDITAIFTKSEFSVQVSLQIPNDYPLSPPEPTVTKKVKISEEKVRKWLFSMVQLLLQQESSTILELILAWKEHVERELEGIEDCFICYYLVHPTDKSLPNLPCQVCGNKFHKLCIQKWFTSSHNATCPLCRNPFRS